MSDTSEKREVIKIFQRGLDQSAFVLNENPELTFAQIYNRTQWKKENNEIFKNKLNQEEKKFKKPWLKLLTIPVECSTLIRTFSGHNRNISDCAYCPDGKYIFTASWDHVLKLWDVEKGVEILTLLGHKNAVLCCDVSPDGKQIVSGSGDFKLHDPEDSFGELKLWDTLTGKELLTLNGHTHEVYGCAFSPDGKKIVSASNDKTLKIWDAETGKEIITLNGHLEGVRNCSFSPNGKKIISASEDKTLKIWDSNTGKELLTLNGHLGNVNDCAFSSDGKKIVSASSDWTIRLWNTKNGKELNTLKGHTQSVKACAFSPNGLMIVSASNDSTLKIWDSNSGIELANLSGHTSSVNSCCFNPNGNLIVSAGSDQTVRIWDVEYNKKSLKNINIQDSHSSKINRTTFSLDGKRILSASMDKTLKIWDAKTCKLIKTFKGHQSEVLNCTFRPDEKKFISVSMEFYRESMNHIYTFKLWDLDTRKELKNLNVKASKGVQPAFSPDGSRIVSSSDKRRNNLNECTLMYWNIDNEKLISTLKGHTSFVKSCSFSPDGKSIVSGGDKSLKLWDAETGKELNTLMGHTLTVESCVFSPDGRHIISGSTFRKEVGSLMVLTGEIKLWDIQCGEEIYTIKDIIMMSCAFSPDGKRIIYGDMHNTLKILDFKTRKEIAILKEHSGSVSSFCFNPSGKQVVIGDSIGHIIQASLENFEISIPIITPIKNSKKKLFKEFRLKRLYYWCAFCQKQNDIEKSELGKVVNCGFCGEKHKLNSFFIELD